MKGVLGKTINIILGTFAFLEPDQKIKFKTKRFLRSIFKVIQSMMSFCPFFGKIYLSLFVHPLLFLCLKSMLRQCIENQTWNIRQLILRQLSLEQTRLVQTSFKIAVRTAYFKKW